MSKAKDKPPTGPSVVWFRNDLRLADNPALHAARERGDPLLCLFVLETDEGLRPHGGASRWWLHHSLASLAADLASAGACLVILEGEAATIVPKVVDAAGAGALFFNRRYGGAAARLDKAVAEAVEKTGSAVETFNGRLLHEPWEIETKAGGSYGVYTPYWKAARERGLPDSPLPKPRKLDGAAWSGEGPEKTTLEALGLLPSKPDWAKAFGARWTPGEAGAAARLRDFLKDDLAGYEEQRNQLASEATSHLSPHLRFGEISPRTIVAAVNEARTAATKADAECFLSEVGWREFDYHVLHHHPDVGEVNLHRNFDRMPWEEVSKADLQAWQQGRTGYPVVDAGMRELWQTGYMHNRVRMITASFLVKDLLCDWRVGEKWFWDCLCDADPANNTMNWQWVAGSGADASPFFRVFNPVTQGEKFDPKGDYVRRWVPELGELPGKAIHTPWEAGEDVLRKAGIELGKTYPKPILDHKKARQRALDAYEKVKG